MYPSLSVIDVKMANSSHSKMIQKIPWSTLRKDQRDMLKNMIKLIPQVDLLEANLDASQILFQFQLVNH